eukprot:4600774-Prymnesium_polylepis.1
MLSGTAESPHIGRRQRTSLLWSTVLAHLQDVVGRESLCRLRQRSGALQNVNGRSEQRRAIFHAQASCWPVREKCERPRAVKRAPSGAHLSIQYLHVRLEGRPD